jgi:hypothetical protein
VCVHIFCCFLPFFSNRVNVFNRRWLAVVVVIKLIVRGFCGPWKVDDEAVRDSQPQKTKKKSFDFTTPIGSVIPPLLIYGQIILNWKTKKWKK